MDIINNSLFEFDDKFRCHCEQRSDEAIQEENAFGLPSQNFVLPRNDIKAIDCSDTILIGTDEAGRGPGAGGVFAAAVCFHEKSEELIAKLSCLNDSKKLSKKKREELYDIILENTINSIVCVEVEEIEKINILNASLKAMKLACENVTEQTCRVGLLSHQSKIMVVVDGNKLIKNFNYPQQYIIKGDGKSASIAAASILAKVSRDRYMEDLDKKFPQYNWAKNAGYLTKEHLSAITEHGITPHHRKSFLKKFEARQLSLLT